MAKIKSDKKPTITSNYEVPNGWVKELNFFDMTGKKAGTKGTSNKFYENRGKKTPSGRRPDGATRQGLS
jgi:hypothetical protein